MKKNNNIIFKKFFNTHFLTSHNINTDKKIIINQLTKNLKTSPNGYAGFLKKNQLRNFIQYQIFDQDNISDNIKKIQINKTEVTKIIKGIIKKCYNVLPSSFTNIYIFPSYNSFAKKNMKGVSGYTPWKQTIIIFINPAAKEWKKALKPTIAHEYAHSVTRQYHQWTSLLDSIVFEGLAENFSQKILKTKPSPWSKSLSLNQSKNYFKQIKKYLKSKDIAIYRSVFFENKKYPLWTGYAIGYNIVKKFLKNKKNTDWIELIKMRPETILKQSKF